MNVPEFLIDRRTLSAEEEHVLAVAAVKKGDLAAQEKLVKHHWLLAVGLARSIVGPGILSDEDVSDIATQGLLSAIKTFNCKPNMRLSGWVRTKVRSKAFLMMRSRVRAWKSSQRVASNDPGGPGHEYDRTGQMIHHALVEEPHERRDFLKTAIPKVKQWIKGLPPRSQAIFWARCRGDTLGTLARRYKVSGPRIGQIYAEVVTVIKRRIAESKYETLDSH